MDRLKIVLNQCAELRILLTQIILPYSWAKGEDSCSVSLQIFQNLYGREDDARRWTKGSNECSHQSRTVSKENEISLKARPRDNRIT